MNQRLLKYGCNPNQKPAAIAMADGGDLPLTVLNGQPGYINFLDALNAWQLVRELKQATGLPAAASFKHVSPAGAAVGTPLDDRLKRACFVEDVAGLDDSPLACAYARARGADRLCSFGDWIALSDTVDALTARLIAREVSDGVVAPGYDEEALRILSAKRGGNYAVVQMDPLYEPPQEESRQVFGITLSQRRNDQPIFDGLFHHVPTLRAGLPPMARRDLMVAMITLKYTQSNSVCLAKDGQAIGVGAGQQSRVHCTRLAADKADLWSLRQHDKTLNLPLKQNLSRPERDNAVDDYLSDRQDDLLKDGRWQAVFDRQPQHFPIEERRAYLRGLRGVSLASDAFFPFDDSIVRAAQSGVEYVAQPGGSVRDGLVVAACDRLKIAMAMTGVRLFHH